MKDSEGLTLYYNKLRHINHLAAPFAGTTTIMDRLRRGDEQGHRSQGKHFWWQHWVLGLAPQTHLQLGPLSASPFLLPTQVDTCIMRLVESSFKFFLPAAVFRWIYRPWNKFVFFLHVSQILTFSIESTFVSLYVCAQSLSCI